MSGVHFLEIGFENCESIVIPMERIVLFEHADLIYHERMYRDFKLDYPCFLTDSVSLVISIQNEDELEYNPRDEDEPLGMYASNPTSNYVQDRPNILGRILGNDVVDITLLDENKNTIQNIHVPWNPVDEYTNRYMKTTITKNTLDITFKETLSQVREA